MIAGYEVFKLYLALKIHFESDFYDVFKNNGAVSASYKSFEKRNDRQLFIKLGKLLPSRVLVVRGMVANIAYGNPTFLYDLDKALYNYNLWERKRQSITKVFSDDLQQLSSFYPQEIFRASISIESKVILNDLISFTDNISVNPLTENKIRLIRKLHRFVVYDKEKVYAEFLHLSK